MTLTGGRRFFFLGFFFSNKVHLFIIFFLSFSLSRSASPSSPFSLFFIRSLTMTMHVSQKKEIKKVEVPMV